MELFGWSFKRTKKEQKYEDNLDSQFTTEQNVDGAVEIIDAGTGVHTSTLSLDTRFKQQADAISQYRKMANIHDVDNAIGDIVDEAITIEDDNIPVSVDLSDTDYSDKIKEMIMEEHENILSLLDFTNNGYEIFKSFYIDGKLDYHVILDAANSKKGIRKLVRLDPRLIKLVREVGYKTDGNYRIPNVKREFYIYDEKINEKEAGDYWKNAGLLGQAFEIEKDSIVEVHSGKIDPDTGIIQSHLHKAIKVLNQLSVLEDSLVIYRLSRAPERRAFYIDVGSLPKGKAHEYLRHLKNSYKSKISYNAADGSIKDGSATMTMLEDFWLPRREGGRGTEIQSINGGANLGEIDDILYFQKRLYKSLEVPVSRMDSEATVNFGRGSEITRDELKFNKFVNRVRNRFSVLFRNLLKIQCLTKRIVTSEEWEAEEQNIRYDYAKDYYLVESKELEVIEARIALMREAQELEGKYVSRSYLRRNILRQSEDEIKQIDDEIKAEIAEGLYGLEDDEEQF